MDTQWVQIRFVWRDALTSASPVLTQLYVMFVRMGLLWQMQEGVFLAYPTAENALVMLSLPVFNVGLDFISTVKEFVKNVLSFVISVLVRAVKLVWVGIHSLHHLNVFPPVPFHVQHAVTPPLPNVIAVLEVMSWTLPHISASLLSMIAPIIFVRSVHLIMCFRAINACLALTQIPSVQDAQSQIQVSAQAASMVNISQVGIVLHVKVNVRLVVQGAIV